MTTRVITRLPRRPGPALPTGEVILDPPPELPSADGKSWTRALTILPVVAGTAAMALLMGAGRSGPLIYIAGGMYGLSALGMIGYSILGQTVGVGKREMVRARRDYLRHLAEQRRQVRSTIDQQRTAMHYRHPAPATLWATIAGPRLWERRPDDWDFGVLRLGLGAHRIATPFVPPQTRPVDELEPMCALALRRFVLAYSVVQDLPVALSLRGFAHVYLRGDHQRIRAMARAILAQYVTFHAPDDALLALCVNDDERATWEWAKWLPHAVHPTKTDSVGPLRLVSSSVVGVEAMLSDLLASRTRFTDVGRAPANPHILVVLDGGAAVGSDHVMAAGGTDGTTVLHLGDPPPRTLDDVTLVLDIADDGTVRSTTMSGQDDIGRYDTLGAVEAEALARRLAPLRLSAASRTEQPLSAELGLSELLGIGEPFDLDLGELWAVRPHRERLRIPFGIDPDGRPVELDLKESAQDGMGPHGLLIGATGSGKSELLRTLVLALAMRHHPESLNFVLVDFKGGATFATLDRLPHTSAVITNLADELSLVDRMLDAIGGELVRRQELLREAGNLASQRDYEHARASGAPLVPLPSLLIICDEFSELLTARPDFIDMFVQIGRVGRSLGVHLLLASQRLEEGRLRGLETHLSYRIGLRTFSSMESRVVLGVVDAYELPRSPGNGYLKTGTEQPVRFKAAYVSGRHRRSEEPVAPAASNVRRIRPYSTSYVPGDADRPALPEQEDRSAEEPGDTLLDIVVAQLEGRGIPARQVWLPPLAEPPTLDRLLPSLGPVETRGLTTADPGPHGALHAVTGVVDRPFEQRRDPLWLDLSGAGGNAIVAGGPQSGKSTWLRTVIGSLVLTHTPREAQFYCLDFGGGTLRSLSELPHVGGVAGRLDADQVRRTVAELYTLMLDREQRFAAHGVDGMATYRRLKREGRFGDDEFGDVFLVVDGWQTLRAGFEDLEPTVAELTARGLGFGIHVLATCNRWMEVRPASRDAFGTKVELRLGEPAESVINRRASIRIPKATPGRGLTPDSHEFLTGLPRLDGVQTADDLTVGVAKFVQAVRDNWPGESAPSVRQLPFEFPYSALAQVTAGSTDRGIAIGIAEADLQPVYLDFRSDPHLLLFGDMESGKTSFLRMLARAISDRYPPDRARIVVVDHRRGLLSEVDSDHLLGYASTPAHTEAVVAEIAEAMRNRLPGPDVTPAQLREHSWWTGPELYLLIDDHDLVATGPTGALSPLVELLAHGRDIGLHAVVTRRVSGAGRAMFDPVLSRLRDLSSPGLLLSGPPEEGPVLGSVKPRPLPAGRGRLITRRSLSAQLIQLAWLPAQA